MRVTTTPFAVSLAATLAFGCTELLPGDQEAFTPDMGAPDMSDGSLAPCPLAEGDRGATEVMVPATLTEGDADGRVDWTCDSTYRLTGPTVVANDLELRIQSGTRIVADDGAYLYVRVGSRLTAQGSADAPIVFTSSAPVGERRRNGWRGVFLAGRAPHNFTSYTPADAPSGFAAVPSGTDVSWSCGRLTYVRIEFAGITNGAEGDPGAALTLIGCGSGTEIDFVQAHSTEDGFGFVGGGGFVARHLIASAYRDDGIEWTGGFGARDNGGGGVQFAVTLGLSDSGAGIQGNNNETAVVAAPRSEAFVANLTSAALTGGFTNEETGVEFRFGSLGVVANSLFTHLGRGMNVGSVLRLDDFSSDLEPAVSGSVFVVGAASDDVNIDVPFPGGPQVGMGTEGVPESPDDDGGFDEYRSIGINDTFTNRGANPTIPDVNVALGSCCAFGGPFDFVPTQPVDIGTRTPVRPGFDSTDYVGAFEGNDPAPWDRGWTDYPAN